MPGIRIHPALALKKYFIGLERAPLLVIDNLIEDPEALVNFATNTKFTPMGRSFPGIRAPAPLAYHQFLLACVRPYLDEQLDLGSKQFKISMCHYSIVTTHPSKLTMIQRIPHFDSTEPNGLATIHYLFKQSLGGTAFYRHRKTGFEYIDESRKLPYFASLQAENDGPDMPEPGYIDSHTPLFEQIASQEGVFNRMLIYRRNSLHSGCIPKGLELHPDPSTGRLSINSFIDLV